MERLTERVGKYHKLKDYVEYPTAIKKLSTYEDLEEECHKINHFSLRHLMHKWEVFLEDVQELLEYRKLEEQGLLLRLKLKAGDTFWELNDNFLEPAIYPRKAHSLQHVLYCMDRLGKVTFLTKEEAEQKLASMQKGE